VNYHPDDFLALVQEAENQGGAFLSNDICKPHKFRLDMPASERNPKGPKVSTELGTTGCHRRAKFVVPPLPDAYFEQVNLLDGAQHGTPTDDGRLVRRDAEDADFDFDDSKYPVVGDVLVTVCSCSIRAALRA
jgi:hypothetical protein